MSYSETFFQQGETARGKWQSKHHKHQDHQGYRESHTYAEANGLENSNRGYTVTEAGEQDHVIFEVSPDGTVTLIKSVAAYSYASSRSIG
jgi:hypothetical protein